MKYTEIILLLFITVLFLYIIFRWINKKRGNSASREGMEVAKYPSKKAFMDPENLPLKEYAIYSSFNSAYDGYKITLEQLGMVMYEGCRFIDINVFYAGDDLYVGFANDNAPTMIDNSLKLSEVVKYINNYAFTIDQNIADKVNESYTKMIEYSISSDSRLRETIQKTYINYPLFLNVRVFRPPDSEDDIVSNVLDTLTGENGLKHLYKNEKGEAIPVNQYTRLNKIRKNVILSMDFQNIVQIHSSDGKLDTRNIPPAILDKLNKSSNVQVGSNIWNAFYNYDDVEKNSYSILQQMDTSLQLNHSYETNTDILKLAYPYFNNDTNPDSYKYIKNYKIQTIPFRFYLSDANVNLANYKKLFYTNKTPFLPLYYAYSYIVKNQSQTSQ